jgi:urea transport system permease protein
MSPNLIGVVPSIDMVIFAAVGGRLSLYGAVYGTLLVTLAKSLFSESYPNLWMFFYGSLFIVIVILLPKGLAGLYQDYLRPWVAKLIDSRKRRVPVQKETVTSQEGKA